MTTVKRSLAEILAEKKAIIQQRKEAKEREADSIVPIEAKEVTIVETMEAPQNPTTPQNPTVIKKLSLKELLEQRKLAATLPVATLPTEEKEAKVETEVEAKEEVEEQKKEEYKGAFSLNITLNSKQLLAKEMAFAGKSFCIVGAAGTGKTTAQREVAAALLESGILRTHSFRIQGIGEREECPSIAFVAYTRVASGNLRRAIHKSPALEAALPYNVTTVHNLLEYTPETYWNYEENKKSFRFIPKRTKGNPLDITHLVIEEASMVSLDLWDKLFDAMRPGTQVILIGDINQLPPVFGDAILNYGLVQLPVVELTHVYRQADGSSLLENAHRILRGEAIVESPDFKIIRGGTTNFSQSKLSIALGSTFPKWAESGDYDPMQDIILSPWNKRELGTDNMNKWIAQFLGTKRKATVHEVIAGMSKVYLAVGDKVMYNKEVGVITSIHNNARYMGRSPLPPSTNLTRFGSYTGGIEESEEDFEGMDYSSLDLDKMLEDEQGDRMREASHIVDILMDDGRGVVLNAVGEFAPATFSLAYALTVHKAQGCEWRRVFLILHRDHAVSLCRELLYTAVTRAREKLILIAKDEVLNKAIAIQRIKGNNTAEKIEWFNSGIKLNNAVHCTK